MTRYTNVGRKRTYLQANFDPNDDQIASNVTSTSSLRPPNATFTLHESIADPPAESRRKRPRKSKESSEETKAAEPGPASVDGDGSRKNLQVSKSERKKKSLAKLKAKEKAKERAKRAKSACFFSVLYIYIGYAMAIVLTPFHNP
jgi:zinc finger CCHC domain-containing protein 9